MEASQDRLLNMEDVSELLGISKDLVEDWTKKGILPSYRLNGMVWRFKRSEIEEWIEKQKYKKAD